MQFTKPSFLETKIEDKFFVLKSKNDKDKNKLLKKEIDLNYIQFHFVIDGNATFSFNNGAYKMDVSKGKYIVLYNPKKNLPVDALIHTKSYVLSVLISIQLCEFFKTNKVPSFFLILLNGVQQVNSLSVPLFM